MYLKAFNRKVVSGDKHKSCHDNKRKKMKAFPSRRKKWKIIDETLSMIFSRLLNFIRYYTMMVNEDKYNGYKTHTVFLSYNYANDENFIFV